MEPPQFTLPNQPAQPEQSPQPAANNPLAVMQPDEQIICEIKRHPIGMIGIYLAAGSILIVLAILALIVVPNAINGDNRDTVVGLTTIAFIVFSILLLIFVFISNVIYWGNRWVITSDSLTQLSQTGLFSKQSAQLSLGNLEDITVEQNGILTQIFKFGVLKAETAGERSKFVFLYCPRPSYYAQKILAAREIFEQVHHGGKQEPYHAPQTTQFPASQPSASPPSEFPQNPTIQPPSDSPQYQVGQTPPNFTQSSTAPQPLEAPISPDYPPTLANTSTSSLSSTSSQNSSDDLSKGQSASTTSPAYPDSDQPFSGVDTNTTLK